MTQHSIEIIINAKVMIMCETSKKVGSFLGGIAKQLTEMTRFATYETYYHNNNEAASGQNQRESDEKMYLIHELRELHKLSFRHGIIKFV